MGSCISSAIVGHKRQTLTNARSHCLSAKHGRRLDSLSSCSKSFDDLSQCSTHSVNLIRPIDRLRELSSHYPPCNVIDLGGNMADNHKMSPVNRKSKRGKDAAIRMRRHNQMSFDTACIDDMGDGSIDKLTGRIMVAVHDYRTSNGVGLERGHIDVYSGDRVLILRSNGSREWVFVRNLRTLHEGYVPMGTLAFDAACELGLSGESWYHRFITRKDAERMLLKSSIPHGSYLVRDCETSPSKGVYSLSVRDFDPIKGNHVKHYRLHSSNGFFIDPRNVFPTISSLIGHYTLHCDGLCCKLSVPCHQRTDSLCDASQYNKQALIDPDIWNVSRNSFKFIRKLGQGMFGEVWQGKWNKLGCGNTMVAIKTLKSGSMSTSAFLEEANIMKRLRHPNLVRLYAVCTDGDPLFIVTEYMVNGSLLEYLRSASPGQNGLDKASFANRMALHSSKMSDISTLIDFASQIAAGMTYLEHHHYIHRDLATRNVLVDEDCSVKIADFGLARFIEEDEYTAHAGARFPIKWTAPEAARYGTFTIKSDVWSFGILLTELMTYGQAPYPGMSTTDVLDNVQSGYRMPKPNLCPELVYDLMLRCWDACPERRPTFEFLHMFFDDFAITSQPAYHPTA